MRHNHATRRHPCEIFIGYMAAMCEDCPGAKQSALLQIRNRRSSIEPRLGDGTFRTRFGGMKMNRQSETIRLTCDMTQLFGSRRIECMRCQRKLNRWRQVREHLKRGFIFNVFGNLIHHHQPHTGTHAHFNCSAQNGRLMEIHIVECDTSGVQTFHNRQTRPGGDQFRSKARFLRPDALLQPRHQR